MRQADYQTNPRWFDQCLRVRSIADYEDLSDELAEIIKRHPYRYSNPENRRQLRLRLTVRLMEVLARDQVAKVVDHVIEQDLWNWCAYAQEKLSTL